uniref:BOS complex subunit TMEM147 n=1 Tax=Phocoena sinus TaxID=42100 RepID=A0A8C9CDD2_PHOSS
GLTAAPRVSAPVTAGSGPGSRPTPHALGRPSALTPRAAPAGSGSHRHRLGLPHVARAPRRSLVTLAHRAADSGSQKAARAAAEAGGRQARARAPGSRGREARSGEPGGRRHDAVPLRELLRPGLLPLLHHLQVQRPVSAGQLRGGRGAGGRGPGRPLTARSRRSEYNAFWKCVQAGVTYLFVQLCKMLFLATFFPTWEGGIYDFIGVHYIVASAQVWMITRYDLYHTFRPAVLLLMFLSVYKAFVMETFVHLCSLGSWTALLARAVVTGLLALSTLALYVAVVNVHS